MKSKTVAQAPYCIKETRKENGERFVAVSILLAHPPTCGEGDGD
jgi:hypothetical protein